MGILQKKGIHSPMYRIWQLGTEQDKDTIPAIKRHRVDDDIQSLPWAICLFGYLEVFPQIVQQFRQQVMGAFHRPPVIFACICTQTSKTNQPIVGQLDRVDLQQIQRWLPELAQCKLIEPASNNMTLDPETTERECLQEVIQLSFEYEARCKVQFDHVLLARPNLYYQIPIHTKAIHQWSGRVYIPTGKPSHVAIINRSTLNTCLRSEQKHLWTIFFPGRSDDICCTAQTVQTVVYPFTEYVLAVWPSWVLQQAGFRSLTRQLLSTPPAVNQ